MEGEKMCVRKGSKNGKGDATWVPFKKFIEYNLPSFLPLYLCSCLKAIYSLHKLQNNNKSEQKGEREKFFRKISHNNFSGIKKRGIK